MGETPEDVAVLYSWANLHGAKYRDFSASRREYRAQLRHRAAEQAREQELRAQADAEAAAALAETSARKAEHTARQNPAREDSPAREQVRREAEGASRVASAERIEAARRAEAAALAEAAARREEREIAEAAASARRQAAQYADSEIRRRQDAAADEAELPGRISDPYTPQPPNSAAVLRAMATANAPARFTDPLQIVPRPQTPRPAPAPAPQPSAAAPQPPAAAPQPPAAAPVRTFAEPAHQVWDEMPAEAAPLPLTPPSPSRRPRGYRPDDASGVRQIYRGPDFEQSRPSGPIRQLIPARAASPEPPRERPLPPVYSSSAALSAEPATPADAAGAWTSTAQHEPAPPSQSPRRALWSSTSSDPSARPAPRRSSSLSAIVPAPGYLPGRTPPATRADAATPPSAALEDPGLRRRRQDLPANQPVPPQSSSDSSRRERVFNAQPASTTSRPGLPVNRTPSPEKVRPAHPPASPVPPAYPIPPASPVPPAPPSANPQDASTAPAWLYSPQDTRVIGQTYRSPASPPSSPSQSSVADTLQHSRERVASRWYALKGVFEQPGQERVEPRPVRQKETRTPVVAVFSLAGGVGKTSLVATLGRSLSSLGEKVLLTDTTSHGLLPFYFGASELRQGTVRTFSPPSGSTDAPIYLVSYDVEEKNATEESQEELVDEITNAGRGTHRVLLDLTVHSGWVARRMARLKPTILVPLAPDMNSVISLQSVDKFFAGIADSDGKPLQIFYVLNQFDASLPLHLDVREVLRRQLGERLLPIVIRRAPAVSEALAEGMTIIDYSPEAPVAEDYLAVATWIRTLAAPATAGFRNVRWSER